MSECNAPPKSCDVCQDDCRGEYNDARIQTIVGRKIWATCCTPCAIKYGARYGVGEGQRFFWSNAIGYYKVLG